MFPLQHKDFADSVLFTQQTHQSADTTSWRYHYCLHREEEKMKLTKSEFVKNLNNKQIALEDIEKSQTLTDEMKNATRTADRNNDGVIKGNDEAAALFGKVDAFDNNGSTRSIDTGTASAQTKAGIFAQEALSTAKSAGGAETTSTSRTGSVRDTSNMTEEQKYDYFSGLIEQNGGQLKTGTNERNILGIRNETDADVNGGNGAYDDKFVMLWKDQNGNKRVREYTGNTEPSARYRGRYGEDVNGDGKLDQGRLPTGYYEFRRTRHSKFGTILKPTAATAAERDTNQDGLFNDNALGDAGRTMLFHKGGNSMTGSAGCQTFSPSEWRRFTQDLSSNGNPGVVGYTLINN